MTNPDKPFRLTVVGDDCAVPRKQGSLVGRRGLAGTVVVYKIASALAQELADIDDVYALSEYVATRVGTIGAGLDHCRAFYLSATSSTRSRDSFNRHPWNRGCRGSP